MSFNEYFRIALFLPYICAALAFLSQYILPINDFTGLLLSLILAPVLLGGIPYAIFVYFTFTWSKTRSERDIRKWMWKAPLFFLPLLILVFILIFPTSNYEGVIIIFVLITMIVLAYGYSYILLAHCGWIIIRKLGWGKESFNES